MGRNRATDFAEKQRDILDSAAEVFATQGMEKASMSQIAAHARTSKALLYHYYPSKDALIFAIIVTHLEELDAAIAVADNSELPAQQRLRSIIGAILENYRGADNQHKVQLNAAPVLSAPLRTEIMTIERRIVRRISTVLHEINPRLDSAGQPFLMPVTMSLFGMLNWVYTWFKEDGRISRDDYADIATTLILEGVGAIGR